MNTKKVDRWIIQTSENLIKQKITLHDLRKEDFEPSRVTLLSLENLIHGVSFETTSTLYAYTRGIESKCQTNDLNNIMWRVLVTIWYKLAASVQMTCYRASGNAIEHLARDIEGPKCEDSAALVRVDIAKWQLAGRRFEHFAVAAHAPHSWIAVLLTYPCRLPNHFVAKLPIKGPKFDKAIKIFRRFVSLSTQKEPQIERLAAHLADRLVKLRQSLRPVRYVGSAHILSPVGLIKFTPGFFQGPTENRLQEFYIRSVCTGRTLLRDNIYLAQVLPLLPHNEALRSIVYALAASYYKEYLEDGSQEKGLVSSIEATCIQTASKALQSTISSADFNAIGQNPGSAQQLQVVQDTFRMLYVHHAILNPGLHSQSWTKHLRKPMGPFNDAAVVLASHSIWLMAFLPLENDHDFLSIEYSWLVSDASTMYRVHGIVGCSPSLLLIQYYIRSMAMLADVLNWSKLRRRRQGLEVVARLQQLPRWVDESERDQAREIALQTHDTFVDATILYAYVRYMRYVPHDPRVQTVASRLARNLCNLPSEGKLYSGLHPAWCFLIACACTTDIRQYNSMITILHAIGRGNKSNVSAVAEVANTVWEWKKSQVMLCEGWWEDMTLHIREKMGDSLICVT